MGALQIKNIPTGPGDDIKIDASWSKGDTKNVISTSAASPSFAMMGGTAGQFGPDNSYGFGATTDGVWLPVVNGGDGSIHLTEAFGIRGAFNHNWDPYWSTSVFGSAAWVRYDDMRSAVLRNLRCDPSGPRHHLQLRSGLQGFSNRCGHSLDSGRKT